MFLLTLDILQNFIMTYTLNVDELLCRTKRTYQFFLPQVLQLWERERKLRVHCHPIVRHNPPVPSCALILFRFHSLSYHSTSFISSSFSLTLFMSIWTHPNIILLLENVGPWKNHKRDIQYIGNGIDIVVVRRVSIYFPLSLWIERFFFMALQIQLVLLHKLVLVATFTNNIAHQNIMCAEMVIYFCVWTSIYYSPVTSIHKHIILRPFSEKKLLVFPWSSKRDIRYNCSVTKLLIKHWIILVKKNRETRND